MIDTIPVPPSVASPLVAMRFGRVRGTDFRFVAPRTLASVPPEIDDAIRRSERIANLGDDWDDQGSPGYEYITWERAVDFLRRVASLAYGIPTPVISPADEGTIDLHWRLDDRSMVINFAPDDDTPVITGSRFDGSDPLRGPATERDIALWLTRP